MTGFLPHLAPGGPAAVDMGCTCPSSDTDDAALPVGCSVHHLLGVPESGEDQ